MHTFLHVRHTAVYTGTRLGGHDPRGGARAFPRTQQSCSRVGAPISIGARDRHACPVTRKLVNL